MPEHSRNRHSRVVWQCVICRDPHQQAALSLHVWAGVATAFGKSTIVIHQLELMGFSLAARVRGCQSASLAGRRGEMREVEQVLLLRSGTSGRIA